MKTDWKFTARCALAAALVTASGGAAWAGKSDVRHGRFLIQVGGCNDCHTAGFMEKDGHVPEKEWLTGDTMGWHGPWGTTYAANLRLVAHALDEKGWIARARQPLRPPMPTPSLRAMSDSDLVAIHRYLRSLGPQGKPAPAYVPPGGKIATPYFDLTPKNLPVEAAKK